METKVCTKCGIEKPLSEFYESRSCKDGCHGSCKICFQEYDKKCDPTKKKERHKKYAAENKKYLKKYHKIYYAIPENKERIKKKQSNSRAALADPYIIDAIHRRTKMSPEEIRENPELIEQKRTIIKFKRNIKQLKQEQNAAS